MPVRFCISFDKRCLLTEQTADNAFLVDPFKFGYENRQVACYDCKHNNTRSCVYCRWNEYMQSIEFVAATKPYMVCPGNHEAECHSPVCQLDNTLKHKLHNFTVRAFL